MTDNDALDELESLAPHLAAAATKLANGGIIGGGDADRLSAVKQHLKNALDEIAPLAARGDDVTDE